MGTILVTKLQTAFEFHQLFYYFPFPIQDPVLHLVAIFSWSRPVCDSFSVSHDLNTHEEVWPVILWT